MNMSEKVSSYGRENLQESNVLPDNFFHCQKRDMTSSVTRSERYKYFSSFLKYNFCNKSASFFFVFLYKSLHCITPE